MALTVELKIFEQHRGEWLEDHTGWFALVKGQDYSLYESDEKAYEASLDKYGNADVLIKQILPEDLVEDSLALLYGLVNVPA